MKFLFLVLFAFLLGCAEEPSNVVKQEELQFKANDMVLIHGQPFYENCFGAIVDYYPRKNDNGEIYYRVAVFCRLGPLGKIIDSKESDLQLRMRTPLNTEIPQ
jgi:hypothetical protein